MSTFYNPDFSWIDSNEIWVEITKDYSVSNPFEAKCLYVFGTVRHLLYAGEKLYPTHILPAYSLGFNAVELLGRCLRGDTSDYRGSTKRLESGLKYMAKTNKLETLHVRNGYSYTVPDKLVKIRNFAAHGFYGSDEKLYIDRQLVAWIFGALGDAIQRYYHELERGENYENMLKAKIQPLMTDGKSARIGPVKEDIQDDVSLSQPGGTRKGTSWEWQDDYENVKTLQGNEWFLSFIENL